MSEQKTRRRRKGLVIAAAAVLVILCAMLTANAATDGAIFNGDLFRNLKFIINGKEYVMNDYMDEAVLTTDADGNTVMHYSYHLPGDKKVDAYAGEEYTAFAVDADDAESIRIIGETQADTE